jgi:hypothetical protein
MGRPKKYFTPEQSKEMKNLYNKLYYNKALANQKDSKRFIKSCEIIERYLAGIEVVNKNIDEKITVDTSKIEQLLKKAKAINLAVNIENSVKNMMTHNEGKVVEKVTDVEQK